MFLFQENAQADQSRCPSPPDGFPGHMMIYDRFADERGWHPRQVDQLTREELFWLPVIREARAGAVRQLEAARSAQERQQQRQ